MTRSGMNGLNIRINAVPNGTGPGVRRSKRRLLASRTRCKCPKETSRNGNNVRTVIRSSLVTRSRFSEMSDQLRV